MIGFQLFYDAPIKIYDFQDFRYSYNNFKILRRITPAINFYIERSIKIHANVAFALERKKPKVF